MLHNMQKTVLNKWNDLYPRSMKEFSESLLDWYDRNARTLPWRISPQDRAKGIRPDPYRVWLSEIMLQQTTIPHGMRYFLRFTELWSNVDALASASQEEVMHEWAGLGYYARARNLHACAKIVSEAGGFPQDAQSLMKLPGVGPYTAGAIAAIAFDEPKAAVDGNVERVLTRYYAVASPLPDIKSELKTKAQGLVPTSRPGDFAQALMDLGATVCKPREALCDDCPLSEACVARKDGNPLNYPVKGKKKDKPQRFGHVTLVHDGERLLVERRPENGLLAGMIGLPTSDWFTDRSDFEAAGKQYEHLRHVGRVAHVFTHFRLELEVYEDRRSEISANNQIPLKQTGNSGMPSVFEKARQKFVDSDLI